MKILSQMYPRTMKSLLNFGNNPDPDSESRPYSPWWMCVVSEYSCFVYLMCKGITYCSYHAVLKLRERVSRPRHVAVAGGLDSLPVHLAIEFGRFAHRTSELN